MGSRRDRALIAEVRQLAIATRSLEKARPSDLQHSRHRLWHHHTGKAYLDLMVALRLTVLDESLYPRIGADV